MGRRGGTGTGRHGTERGQQQQPQKWADDRETTKDKRDNGERRAMPREGMDEEPPLPIPRAMAHRVGWGMLTNTAVFLIYILPPTPSQ